MLKARVSVRGLLLAVAVLGVVLGAYLAGRRDLFSTNPIRTIVVEKKATATSGAQVDTYTFDLRLPLGADNYYKTRAKLRAEGTPYTER
jgi:hypothetical protein